MIQLPSSTLSTLQGDSEQPLGGITATSSASPHSPSRSTRTQESEPPTWLSEGHQLRLHSTDGQNVTTARAVDSQNTGTGPSVSSTPLVRRIPNRQTRQEREEVLFSQKYYHRHGLMKYKHTFNPPNTVLNLPTKAELGEGESVLDVLTAMQYTIDALIVIHEDQVWHRHGITMTSKNWETERVSEWWITERGHLEEEVETEIESAIEMELDREKEELEALCSVSASDGAGLAVRNCGSWLMQGTSSRRSDIHAGIKLSAAQAERLRMLREASKVRLNEGDGRTEGDVLSYDPEGESRGRAGAYPYYRMLAQTQPRIRIYNLDLGVE